MELTENGNFPLLAANGNGNDKLPFVCCKQKWKMEVYFPRLANNKKMIIDDAVSANVPIYAN
jgi:hypothetical protein